MFALAILPVSGEIEPRKRFKDVCFVFRLRTRRIRILYAQYERAAGVFREEIGEHRGAIIAGVEESGRRWGEAGNDGAHDS